MTSRLRRAAWPGLSDVRRRSDGRGAAAPEQVIPIGLTHHPVQVPAVRDAFQLVLAGVLEGGDRSRRRGKESAWVGGGVRQDLVDGALRERDEVWVGLSVVGNDQRRLMARALL